MQSCPTVMATLLPAIIFRRMRMCLLVGFLHATGADVGVDLRRGETLVAEQFLDTAQVGAAVEQVRGETMPQRVRCRGAVEARQHEILVKHPPDAAGRQSLAELIQEERIAVFVLRVRLSNFQPVVERLDRVFAQRADAFFAALPDDPQNVRVSVPAGDVQADDFRDSKPGRVRRLQNRSVPQAGRFVRRWRFQQCRELIDRQQVRQLSTGPRCSQRLRRVGCCHPFAQAKSKQTSQAREPPGDRRLCIVALVKVRDVASQHSDADLSSFRNVTDSILKVGQQAGNVFRVRLHRERRRVLLDLQVTQESVDCHFHKSSLSFQKVQSTKKRQQEFLSGTTGWRFNISMSGESGRANSPACLTRLFRGVGCCVLQIPLPDAVSEPSGSKPPRRTT